MISDKHKFIYTKIAKTGSTTIEKSLPQGRKKGHYHLQDDIDVFTKNYFKFTFVRNPWERCVSSYFYVKQNKPRRGRRYKNSTFREFLVNENDFFNFRTPWDKQSPTLHRLFKKKSLGFEQQIDWISDERGDVLVDFVGKLEQISEDLPAIFERIGIPCKQKIPHLRKSKHKHYTEYYDDETREIVSEKYAKDIKEFGYEFG